MGVYVRKKTLKDGRLSLFIDFYPPIRKGDGTFTRREFLNRYLFRKPKNDEEKRMNRENIHFADSVRLKREKEILNETDGMFNVANKKRDFVSYFLQLTEDRKQSKGNYDNWLSSYNYLKTFTGGFCKMGDIDEKFCNRFKEFLLNTDRINTVSGLKLSNNSTVSYFNKFRAAVNSAFEERLLNHNPLIHVKGIKEKESLREFLTHEELQKLYKTDCEVPLLKTAALFAALTGLRWSDISALKWKDIQYTKENGYFLHIVQQKTQDVIVHPISNNAVKLLGKTGSPEMEIFQGLKYSDSNNDRLRRWIEKAGIKKKITLHNFRHTYATILLNNGADIFTVSKMLGHKNIQTTLIYSKLLDSKKVTAANLINIKL